MRGRVVQVSTLHNSARAVDSLFRFPGRLSVSESSPVRYGLGLARSLAPSRALVAAMRLAPRRVLPLKPRQEARCGAYREDVICASVPSRTGL